MELTYRRAQGSADAKQIARIQNRCAEEITSRLGIGHWSKTSDTESVKRRMESKTLFVVFDVEAADPTIPIATFTVGTKAPQFWPKKIWREPDARMVGVFGISVLPELQRHGIGAWMMDQVAELARTNHATYVRLDAYEENPVSVAFYRKIGYEERGRVVVRTIPLICFEKEVSMPSDGEIYTK